jgi:hypothetical protein
MLGFTTFFLAAHAAANTQAYAGSALSRLLAAHAAANPSAISNYDYASNTWTFRISLTIFVVWGIC